MAGPVYEPEFICGNLFIRPNRLLRAGDQVEGHAHNFDHMTQVLRGRIHVRAFDPGGALREERTFEAFSWCLIRAGWKHELTALEDETLFWCVYAHRDPQGRVHQEFTGWTPAYE